MTIVYDIFLILHFVGLASLLGGFIVQMRASQRVVNPAMLHGALTQLVTGLVLVGIYEGASIDPSSPLNQTAIGVKLVIAFIVTVFVMLGRRKEESQQQPYWAAAGGLALVNVIVAVFWVA
ncbi:unannotated protein [freshwater metagenome]|uniref:Unannotated protein n=1 Tax=freshwater metagenome TaxID=449393 RepID=A0A6J7QKD5_9ZZZZ|nr:hypothetical protein [Actinomycetota bacterium]MSW36256.1 hypothetical protein [Actinomycetota bacterium]MSX38262.1 hypothetical protein [Actinomycetota bacterium]